MMEAEEKALKALGDIDTYLSLEETYKEELEDILWSSS